MASALQFIPNFDSRKDVRGFLINSLERDIIGPSWLPETTEVNLYEELDLGPGGQPDRYYLTGYLSPLRKNEGDGVVGIMGASDDAPPEETYGLSENDKDAKAEFSKESDASLEASGGDRTFTSPSTMGISVLPSSSLIEVEIEWGTYQKEDTIWTRTPHKFSKMIQFSEMQPDSDMKEEIADSVFIYVKKGPQYHQTLTIRLVNEQEQYTGTNRSEVTIFQPRITIRQDFPFEDVRREEEIFEDRTMAILYNDSVVAAQGHNVGVDWSEKEAWTSFLPIFEVPKMSRNKSLDDFVPTMDYLIEEEKLSEGLLQLKGLISEYESWIDAAESILEKTGGNSILQRPEIKERVIEHIENARKNATRMKEGLRLLEDDDAARTAFRLSNAAIRYSQDKATIPEIKERMDKGIQFKWYPFQIAFQLVNIVGLCALEDEDPGRDDREIIDLAWFPTGGGKTEAYLGLISMTGFYRRLRFPENELNPSTHVVMRYTLRLLTSDQADRLVRLAVGMNHIASTMGEELGVKSWDGKEFPIFRVGMWVGTNVSPRDLMAGPRGNDSSAQSSLRSLRNGDQEPGSASVIQFELCPWCNSDSISEPNNWDVIGFKSTSSDFQWTESLNGKPNLHGRCLEKDCVLNERIPYTCVDEDIYLNPPSILLATADKFVQLANNPSPKSVLTDFSDLEANEMKEKYDARSMLGFDVRTGGNRPPDLIIQDELHLLTGPLGTLSGLVETGIDVAWKRAGHRAKYVAATATIRGAEKDGKLMYGRNLNVFPPPMKDANDNFFAIADKEAGKGRVHIGILGPYGKDQTMYTQTSASLLQRSHDIRNADAAQDELIDPYWTLVSYFNSLRELGMAQSQITGRIPEFQSRYATTVNGDIRQFKNDVELTSRRTASELKEQKAALTRELGHDGAVDTVVTTNMFQVGIDISRLGLMVINGQPRSNSEYIQSSGRVGRSHPGLVVSLLRSKYPRDQSHYENFRAFHEEIYRHVDVTSTTPFSSRALDRAITTVLAIIMRMGVGEIAQNESLYRLGYGQLQRDAKALYRDLRTEIKTRQDSTDAPASITQEAIRTLESAFEELIAFAENPSPDNQGEEMIAHWIVWNTEAQEKARKAGKKIPRGWSKSAFMDEGRLNGQNYQINSLRDVAEEVAVWDVSHVYGEVNPGKDVIPIWSKIKTLPEGHFFSQSTPGGLWDKDGETYLTLGVNQWLNGPAKGIQTALNGVSEGGQKLEEAVFSTISTDERQSLRLLPKRNETGSKPSQHGAVTYKKFPQQMGFICSEGHISTIFEPDTKGDWRCTRAGCTGSDGLARKAAPSRWVSVCTGGHLHPFDYHAWAHSQSDTDCPRNSKIDVIRGDSASYTLEGFTVICRECGSSRTMGRVPYLSEKERPSCKGWIPWINGKAQEKCDLKMEHKQTSNISVTYTNNSTIMLLPLEVSWSFAQKPAVRVFKDLGTFELMKGAYNSDAPWDKPRKDNLIRAISNSSYVKEGEVQDKFFRHLEEYVNIQSRGLTVSTLRLSELSALRYSENDDFGQVEDENFDCREVVGMKVNPQNDEWDVSDWPLEMISRADRLTALEYVTGLTRIQPAGEEVETKFIDDPEENRDIFGISRYNHGEGIYIQINSSWLDQKVESRLSQLDDDHANMRLASGKLLPSFKEQMPAVGKKNGQNALTVLHTFSHLIIKELCGMSGYALGSIRERLYLDVDDDGKVKTAGILLYTSGPSSDGTLGGLVSQATEDRVTEAVKRALMKKDNCSNDPVCFSHKPIGDEVNGAACHTCVLLPETSCELRNFYLDRKW